MIKGKSLEETAALMANLARAAYLDDNKAMFGNWGLTSTNFWTSRARRGISLPVIPKLS